ncbi:MAG: hypothetical protein A2V79_12200 [Betaproteobacteria bacterium RBG_16_56_24]|nr:MAG: hypothetical protein A2V79_12200 [Betaproteobacteria bacterium RBG_16_56_24]
MSRWAIYIDIQGFGALWDKGDMALLALGELMRAIFCIGKSCYPSSPDRLFAHQFGDGFLIVSEFEEDSLERCMTIAIALLRHVSVTGCFAKAAIVEGDMVDIKGLYPDEVMDNLNSNSLVDLGAGLMTIVPVMGTALIRGVKLDKNPPKGPLLIIEKEKIDRLPQGLSTSDAGEEVVSINWIAYQSDLLSDIQRRANLKSPSQIEMEESLLRYCKKNEKNLDEWVKNVHKYLLSRKDII